MPSTCAMLAAVTRPTRRLVKGPGPSPATIAARSPGRAPASASTPATCGASSSPCARASTVQRSATMTAPPSVTSARAAVTGGVEESTTSTSTVRNPTRWPDAEPSRTARRAGDSAELPVHDGTAGVGEGLVGRAERARAAEPDAVERAGVPGLEHDVLRPGDQGGLLAGVPAPEQEDDALAAGVQ